MTTNGSTKVANINARLPKKLPTLSETPKTAQTTQEQIIIPALQTRIVRIGVEAVTPLLMHRFSDTQIHAIEHKQQGGAAQKAPPRDPQREMEEALHHVNDDSGRYAIPGIAFKQAAVGACRYVKGITMTYASGTFHVLDDMVPITYDEGPILRTDMVRLESGVASPRYRPEFRGWKCVVAVRYNSAAISASNLVNLFNVAGFSMGVCDWRPEKSGTFGQFQVASEVVA